jgi:TDG/mug DNA glycosylase family protein
MQSNENDTPPLLPEILAPNLDLLVIGAAPSRAAASSGHYYAGPQSRFWLLLSQSGFTPRCLLPEEDATVLDYGIGMMPIYPNKISVSNAWLPVPTEEHRKLILQKAADLAPRFVVFNGKDVYKLCHGQDAPHWGLQDELLGRSKQYVVISASGRADGWAADRLYLWKELRRLVVEEQSLE